MLAIAALNSSGVLGKSTLDSFKHVYDFHKGSAVNRKSLEPIVVCMSNAFDENGNMDVFKFANECNLSDITSGISSALTSANSKIKKKHPYQIPISLCLMFVIV